MAAEPPGLADQLIQEKAKVASRAAEQGCQLHNSLEWRGMWLKQDSELFA